MKFLFLWNLAFAKSRENKILAKSGNHSVLTDIGKACLSHEFLPSQACLLMLFANIKFSQKFPNLQ